MQARQELITLRSLAVKTMLITPSGAFSPGPLTLSALAAGAKFGLLGGVLVATGHMIIELPYILLLVGGFASIRKLLRRAEKPLTLTMLAFILYFSYLLIDSALAALTRGFTPRQSVSSLYEALLWGVTFTAFNPYFLLWWVSVGLPLVRGAAELGARGVAVMYSAHVWMDYAWLGGLALLAYNISVLGGPVYAAFLVALAALLILFGLDMVVSAFTGRRILPI